jgi:hypothetical protein
LAFLLAERPTDSGYGGLTDIAIRKAKPGERLVKLSDGGGLQLWIAPTGGKLWYFAYLSQTIGCVLAIDAC